MFTQSALGLLLMMMMVAASECSFKDWENLPAAELSSPYAAAVNDHQVNRGERQTDNRMATESDKVAA